VLTWFLHAHRAAIHASLLALYGLGGYLVSRELMPIRVLLSAIGFTFSLVFATQGCVQTFSDSQRALLSLSRYWPDAPSATCFSSRGERSAQPASSSTCAFQVIDYHELWYIPCSIWAQTSTSSQKRISLTGAAGSTRKPWTVQDTGDSE
jgi:hypothetical protein